MTSVQTVRPSEVSTGTGLSPDRRETKFVRVKYACRRGQTEHVVQVQESEVENFCLEIDRELHQFNAKRHLGLKTEDPKKQAIKCESQEILDLPPDNVDFHEVTPARLIEMVARQIGPQILH